MPLSVSFQKSVEFSSFVYNRLPQYVRCLVIYALILSMISTSLTAAGATLGISKPANGVAPNPRIASQPAAAARPQPFSPPTSTGTRDSKGTDFWLTFPANSSGGANDQLLISGEQNTTGTVTVTGLGFFTTFSVSAGSATTVNLPTGVDLGQSVDSPQSLGVHVTAQDKISVYAVSQAPSSSDGYLGLPTDLLGNEYITLNYGNSNGGSEFGIVATNDNTTVTVTPSDNVGSHNAFEPFNVSLQQGQTYQLRKDDGGDLTGTIVTSDKPIAVIGGHRCAGVPDGNTPCNYLAEELPPVANWGTSFLTHPFATRQNGDVVRILSSQDGTGISINGVAVATIDRGKFYEQVVTAPSVITADSPVLVSQYSTSPSFDGQTGNAEMMLITPTDRFLSSYTVAMPSSGSTVNYLSVVAPAAAIGSITLDGRSIPAGSFAQIGSSDFSGAQISVTAASHTLTGTESFGVYAYGFGNAGGYAYPAGTSLPFAPGPSATTLTLNPATASSHVNNQSCVIATVTDDLNFPMTSVSVAFNVTGANPNSGSALSDGNGRAQFCYAGSASGQDTIQATTGNLSATALKTWIKASAVTLSPKNATHPVGRTRCVVATAVNQNNSPSVGAALSFSVTGVNPTSGSSQTDINGQGSFCYAGNNAGNDIVTVTTDGASDMANVTWGNTTIQPPPPSINLVVVRHAPSINGHIDGSIQQLLGESVNLNSGANITNDLMVPGTPNVQINGSPTYGGTANGTGSSSPTGYSITINSGVTLGHIVRKTNPITMNSVSAPPGPSGTRDVTINSPGQSAGNFATLRNLTMNANAGQITVPPGTYGAFTANSQSGFTFGVAGSTQPTVYNLQQLILNSNSQLQLLGPVILNLAGNVSINSGVTMGSSSNTSWLSLLIAQNGLTINSAGSLFADVQAPTSTVNINGVLSGSLTCDRLTMNSGSVLKAVGSPTTNQTPQVNAGNGQTISLPANSVTLNGNATDDGLPIGSSLTYSWTKVSGPGTVTFANSAAASTTATFSASGQYVLQLSASDSQLTGSDTIVITVNPINQVPAVSAGSAQTIELPAAALLRGTVTDDGLPAGSTVTSSWAMVSGPGVVTYSSPSSETTSAKFSDPGTYVLRLSASDSQLTGSADVTVTVNPANQAPVVNAGANQVIELPTNTASLTGSATDDGFPVGSTLSYSWRRFSGPSLVTFADPHAAATTATFATVGTYVLRLSVSDGKLTGTSNVTIIVTPANKGQ